MAETVDQVTGSLRTLAVELVRNGRTSEAAAVLAGIGAVEMLGMFAESVEAGSERAGTPGAPARALRMSCRAPAR